MSFAKRDFERWQASIDDAVALLTRIQDALGTAETGDALVEVASRMQKRIVELAAALEEVRNELEDDYDVIDGSDGQLRPNKAMRLGYMINEALYGPGGF